MLKFFNNEKESLIGEEKEDIQYLDGGSNKIKRYEKHIHVSSLIGLASGAVASYFILKNFFSESVKLEYYREYFSIFWAKGLSKKYYFFEGKEYVVKIKEGPVFQMVLDSALISGLTFAISSAAIGFCFYFLKLKFSKLISRKDIDDQFDKGSNLLTEKGLTKQQKKDKVEGPIIGNTAILPKKNETANVFICGAAGSGKTVLLKQVYSYYKKNREYFKAVMHDVKGDWIERFYNPETDYIFNYSDLRGMNFNVFTVLKYINDVGAIVSTIIPEKNGNADPHWTTLSRDILEGVFHYCIKYNKKNHKAVKDLINGGPENLIKKLEGVKGAERALVHLKTDEKQLGINMGAFITECKFFTTMPDKIEGEEFNIIKWLTNEDGKKHSTIFLLNDLENADQNGLHIAVFVNSLVNKLVSLSDCDKRRVFFFLDECGSLKKMPALKRGTTVTRSKGGSFWIGIQDVEQFNSTYGKDEAASILNSCSTTIILKNNHDTTTEFCSRMIGDAKIKSTSFSNSFGTEIGQPKEGANTTIAKKVERAVMASEIKNMNDNTYYFHTKGYYCTFIEKEFTKNDSYEVINKAFEVREDLLLPESIDEELEKNNNSTETVEEVLKSVPVEETQPTQNKFESEL